MLVEGPIDALAVTLTGNSYVGVAPLGTALTEERPGGSPPQAPRRSSPPTPTRPDVPPPNATSGSSPPTASTPDTPGSLKAATRPTCWPSTVRQRSLPCWTRRGRSANGLSRNGSASLPPEQAQLEAARVVAARPPECWDEGSNTISSRLNVPLPAVRQTLLAHVKEWNSDPRRAAAKPLQSVNDVKKRLTEAAPIRPEQRWAALAGQLDQRLLRQGDWPALAQLLQRVDDQGHDVAALTRAVTTTPLNDLPAQDLRYRLAAHLDLGDDLQQPPGPHLDGQDHDTDRDRTGKLPRPSWQRRGRPHVDQTRYAEPLVGRALKGGAHLHGYVQQRCGQTERRVRKRESAGRHSHDKPYQRWD